MVPDVTDLCHILPVNALFLPYKVEQLMHGTGTAIISVVMSCVLS